MSASIKNQGIFYFALIVSFTAFGQGNDINKTDAKGLKQGKWIKKDNNGKTVYEGQFKDNKPYGKFNYYYENGGIKNVSVFSDNGKTARSKLYHENGNLMAEGKYVEEKKDSTWKYYSEEAKLLKEESYLKGKKNGTFIVYAEDGSKVKEENWKNDVQEGPVKEWYEKDKLKMEVNYTAGLMDGKAVYYYPDGSISAAGTFKKGIRDGIWKFSLNGNKSSAQELYKNGVMVKSQRDNGEFTDVYPKSNIPKAVTNYKNSKKNGPFKEFYEAGQWKKQVIPAHDDYPEEIREYLEGQKLKRSGNYKDDKLDGKIIYYKTDGSVEKSEYYVNGVLQKTE